MRVELPRLQVKKEGTEEVGRHATTRMDQRGAALFHLFCDLLLGSLLPPSPIYATGSAAK